MFDGKGGCSQCEACKEKRKKGAVADVCFVMLHLHVHGAVHCLACTAASKSAGYASCFGAIGWVGVLCYASKYSAVELMKVGDSLALAGKLDGIFPAKYACILHVLCVLVPAIRLLGVDAAWLVGIHGRC